MTIYEALSSRTPLVVSDHPMFADHLSQYRAAQIFRASDPQSLADALAQVMSDSSLYESLSNASLKAWEVLQLPVTWGDLLSDWATSPVGEPLKSARHALTRLKSKQAGEHM